jgi:hypothetical protein
MVAMNDRDLNFFDGLLWYLEARAWAFEKVRTCPHGSQVFDVRMHHALYFVNLMSALDHVDDRLNGRAKADFTRKIESGFSDTKNYWYTRELRNAVIHRGLNLTASGNSDGRTLSVLCPAVTTLASNVVTCTFKYLVELGQECNKAINPAINPAIAEVLGDLDLFNPAKLIVDASEVIASIDGSPTMPDEVKQLAKNAMGQFDYAATSLRVAQERIREVRALLDMAPSS